MKNYLLNLGAYTLGIAFGSIYLIYLTVCLILELLYTTRGQK